MGSATLQNERRREREREKGGAHEKEGGFGGDAARKMMCSRGETTSPQGVANLMTADWLCMEYTDTGGRPLLFTRIWSSYVWVLASTTSS